MGAETRTGVYRLFSYPLFLLLLLLNIFPLAHAEETDFSLLLDASPQGNGYVRIQGFLSLQESYPLFELDVEGYEGDRLIEHRRIGPHAQAVFDVQVQTLRSYAFTLSALDADGAELARSETLEVSGSSLVGLWDSGPEVAVEFAPPPLGPSEVPSLVASVSAIEASIAEVQCDTFPYVNLLVEVQRDGATVENLDAGNFDVLEDGVVPASGIEVFPPQTGGSVRIADFVFVFDYSGSMGDDRTRLNQSIENFLSSLGQSDIDYRLGIIPYERNPIIYDNGALTADVDHFRSRLNGFSISGGTESAFKAVKSAVERIQWREGAQKVIILMTDEDDDYGGVTREQLVSILNSAQATAYGIVRSSFGHSNYDFCAAGSITQATGGTCYNIFSPNFTGILDDISTRIGAKYIVKYLSSNTDTQSGNREVVVTVNDAGEQVSASKTFDPQQCNQISIALSNETRNLIGNAQRNQRELPISAVITSVDPGLSLDATLFYRNSAIGYQGTSMANSGSGVYRAVIPAARVIDPFVEFYVSVSDGTQVETLPANDASANPFVISVLPNVPPRILHTPPPSAQQGQMVTVQAEIIDSTNRVVGAQLHYRIAGTRLYTQAALADQGNNLYSTDIPATAVTAASVEYYLYAEDDFGAYTTYGTRDNPIELFVSSGGSATNGYLDIGRTRIWGDHITGDVTGETCSGSCSVSGNVSIGTIVGNLPLLRTTVAVDVDTASGTLSSRGQGSIVALGMRRSPTVSPSDFPLWDGSFVIDGNQAKLTIGSGARSKLKLIGGLLFNWCVVCSDGPSAVLSDDNKVTLKGASLSSTTPDFYVVVPDIVLDPSGNETTGLIELKPEDFGLDSLSIGGKIKLGDFQLSLDFVRQSVTFGGSLEIGKRIKMPKLPMLNIEKIGAKFDLLLDPLAIDGITVSAGLRPPSLGHPNVLSFPQTPPATVGVAPTGMSIGVQNLTGNLNRVRFNGALDGALVDTVLAMQVVKAQTGQWPLSGSFSITFDLSGQIKLAGDAKLLERFQLASASVEIGNPSRVSGEVNLLDALIGAIALQVSSGGNAVSMTGNSSLTLQVPNRIPLVGGYILTQQEVNGLVLVKSSGVETAEFTASFKILFAGFTVKVDLLVPDVSLVSKAMAEGAAEATGVSVAGYDSILNRVMTGADGVSSPAAVGLSVDIPEGQEVVLVRITSETDTPDFNISFPDGTTYTPADAPLDAGSPVADLLYFDSNPLIHEAYYALNHPSGGSYSLEIVNESDLGDYTVEVLVSNQAPQVAVTSPVADVFVQAGDTVTITWSAQDPDNEASICLFLDRDATGVDGSLIACDLAETDGPGYYQWTVPDDLLDPVYVYARVDDGENAPVFAYSTGRLVPVAPNRPSSPAITDVSSGDGSVRVAWVLNDPEEQVEVYRVFLKQGEAVAEFAALSSPFEFDNLANGVGYEVAMSAVNVEGVESERTAWSVFTPNGSSTGGPPDLRVQGAARFSSGDGVYEMTGSVVNQGDYPAYSYDLGCYYDEIAPDRLISNVRYGTLAPQAEQQVRVVWDTSNPLMLNGTNILCAITDVVGSELHTENNFGVFGIEARTGDLDVDGDIDRDDLSQLSAGINSDAVGSDDPRDLDGDGRITVLDYRMATRLCTRPRCATE